LIWKMQHMFIPGSYQEGGRIINHESFIMIFFPRQSAGQETKRGGRREEREEEEEEEEERYMRLAMELSRREEGARQEHFAKVKSAVEWCRHI